MAESSTRILLDRSVIRLDGRPFFAIGTRILLTPAHRIEEAVAHIASNGFNTVITPPTSLGTLPLIDLIFDAAERHGLMVIVATEPFDPEPSAYLARSFRHRQSLHSYCIPTPGDTRETLLWYFRERDRLRTQDLFHPIWTPFRSGYPMALWLESSDLYAVQQGVGGPLPRAPLSQGAETLDLVRKEITAKRAVDRPFICHRFQASISDEARRAGLFDSDPVVRHLPAQ